MGIGTDTADVADAVLATLDDEPMQVGARPAEGGLQQAYRPAIVVSAETSSPLPNQRTDPAHHHPQLVHARGVRAAWCRAWRPSSGCGRMAPGRAPPTVCPALERSRSRHCVGSGSLSLIADSSGARWRADASRSLDEIVELEEEATQL